MQQAVSFATNVAVSGYISRAGMTPVSLFEITPIGLVIVVIGIAYMMLIGRRLLPDHKDESLTILQRYFQNTDAAAMGYLYDETTRRLEKELRADSESIRFHLEMAALDDPRAAKFSEKDFWDSSVVEEIRRSGFIDQLYKN